MHESFIIDLIFHWRWSHGPDISYTTIVSIDSGESNLLRVINVAANQLLFFTIANHMFIIDGDDASYLKPFTNSVIMLGPGQTMYVLIYGDRLPGRYYMVAWAYQDAQNAPFDSTTTAVILEYKSALSVQRNHLCHHFQLIMTEIQSQHSVEALKVLEKLSPDRYWWEVFPRSRPRTQLHSRF